MAKNDMMRKSQIKLLLKELEDEINTHADPFTVEYHFLLGKIKVINQILSNDDEPE